MRHWFREHASALFISTLVLAALGLFFGGLYLSEQAAQATPPAGTALRAVGTILINLSGVAVSATVATVFFSFNDVQNYLATAVARLFSDATVVELLGTEVKARLRRRLVLNSLGGSVKRLDRSLYRHLEVVSRASLGNPYTSNTSWTLTYSPSDIPGFQRNHLVNTYRLHAGHLNNVRTFPLRVYRATYATDALAKELAGRWFESVVIMVGRERFTEKDVKLESRSEAEGVVRLTASLERDVQLLEPETDIHIETKALVADDDPAQCFFTRYASLGFAATVIRGPDHRFYGSWYLYCSPHEHRPAKGEVTVLPGGISVRTNDWVLPGEGVVIIELAKQVR